MCKGGYTESITRHINHTAFFMNLRRTLYFFFLAIGVILGGGEGVIAAPATATCTFPIRDTYWCDVSVTNCDTASLTLTLNKDLYTPSETVTATGVMSLTNPMSGTNDLLTYFSQGFTWELVYHHNVLSATINGVTKEFFNLPFGSGTWDPVARSGCKLSGSCPSSGTATFTAPSVAGTYTATFRGFIEQDYYSGPLTAEKTCSLSYSVGPAATQLPDLTAYAINGGAAVAGTPKVFSVPVSNIGNAPTTAPFWNLLQRADSYVSSTDTATNVVDLRSPTSSASPKAYASIMGPGASATITFNPYTFSAADAAAGSRWLRACADKSAAGAAGANTESNEANNCGPWTEVTITPAPDPDLKGLGTTSSLPSPSTTQAVSFTGSISNIGTASMATYPSVFYITGSGGFVVRVPVESVSTHAAGATVVVTATTPYTFSAPGTYSVRVIANMNETGDFPAVPETVSTNNLGPITQIVVSPSATAPDLTANATTPVSITVGVNGTVSVTSSAKNIGTATATNFPNVFRVLNSSGTQTLRYIDAGTISSLDAGATSVNLSRDITFDTVGSFKIDLCSNVDTAGHIGITEANPENNCGEQATVTVTTVPPHTCTPGDSCLSGQNKCGDSNTGTFDANCVCSATTPPDPVGACEVGEILPEVDITADPERVLQSNFSTRISWSSTNADSCVVSSNPVGLLSSTLLSSPSPQTVVISKQTVFTITCTNEAGSAAKSKVVNMPIGFEEI